MTNAEVKKFLANYSPAIRKLAEQARELVLTSNKSAVEKVYPGWKVIGYGASTAMKDMVVGISPATAHVSLNFMRGAELSDPKGLLEGAGKTGRHVKIRDAEMLQSPAVRLLVREAWRLHGKPAAPREETQVSAGYQVGASKTADVPLDKLYAAWENDRRRKQWLGDAKFTLRKATKNKSMRITWSDGSTVDVLFYAKSAMKSSVSVDHRKLATAKDIAKMRAFWKEKLEALKDLLQD
jgi:hypothetical protein